MTSTVIETVRVKNFFLNNYTIQQRDATSYPQVSIFYLSIPTSRCHLERLSEAQIIRLWRQCKCHFVVYTTMETGRCCGKCRKGHQVKYCILEYSQKKKKKAQEDLSQKVEGTRRGVYINAWGKSYYNSIHNLSCLLLSKNVKINTRNCNCVSFLWVWNFASQMKECSRMRETVNNVLRVRDLSEPKKEELQNYGLRNLYSSPRRMGWAGHVAHIDDMKNSYET